MRNGRLAIVLRCLSILTFVGTLVGGNLNVSACPQSETEHDIAVKFASGKQVRVTGEYEYEGSVIVIPEVEKQKKVQQPKALPLRVSAKFRFNQRSTGENQAIRFYDHAQANIKLDQGTTQPELEPTNRLIVARIKDSPMVRVEMASIQETLSQKEFELIQISADPLTLTKVFARKRAKVGQKWEPNLDALAKFLNVDKILTTDVRLNLKSVERGQARVYLSGGLTAQQYDVTTRMNLGGFAVVDTATDRVQSLKLSTQEDCPPGQIAPGFKGRTRIDQSYTYGVSVDQLSSRSIANAMRSSRIRQRLKFESNGNYRLTYDPRWKLIAGEQESAIMRFVDRGELLTQCTVVMLPQRAANQPLSLKQYRTEIQKIIQKDETAKLVDAKELTTGNGLNAMSVVVAGQQDELPVNWIYYHVSDRQGHQMTFVFTLAERAAGRVLGVAKQLVDEFQFIAAAKKVARKGSRPTVYRAPK